MFGILIESRGARQRRTGSSAASVILHTVFIGAAVAMTARESVSATPPEPRVVTNFVFRPEPKPVVPPLSERPMTASTVTAVPRSLVLSVPLIVPTEIPPIDLSSPPTPTDFSERRVASIGVVCDRDCPRVGAGVNADGADAWTTNDALMRLREDPVPPRYPEVLRRAGIEGSVVVKFVVDTTGRIDMRSIEVLRATHDAFVPAVREVLARYRFTPAMIGTRKVPATAMMPFQFTLK